MARWVAIFEDREEGLAREIRARCEQAHFEYLAANSAEIRIGGGLRPEEGAWYFGGMWVLEAASRERAAELCEADPYFTNGLRKGYRLFVWGKAPCYKDVKL